MTSQLAQILQAKLNAGTLRFTTEQMRPIIAAVCLCTAQLLKTGHTTHLLRPGKGVMVARVALAQLNLKALHQLLLLRESKQGVDVDSALLSPVHATFSMRDPWTLAQPAPLGNVLCASPASLPDSPGHGESPGSVRSESNPQGLHIYLQMLRKLCLGIRLSMT